MTLEQVRRRLAPKKTEPSGVRTGWMMGFKARLQEVDPSHPFRSASQTTIDAWYAGVDAAAALLHLGEDVTCGECGRSFVADGLLRSRSRIANPRKW